MGRKLTIDDIKKSLEKDYGNEWKIIGEFKGLTKSILIEHNCNKCNHTQREIRADTIRKGKAHNCFITCKECDRINRRDEFIKFLNENVNTEESFYTLDESNIKFISDSKKIELIHNICGESWKVTPNNVKNGNRCIHCSNLKPITLKNIQEYIDKNGLSESHTLLTITEPINNKQKILVRHNCDSCGNYVWKVTINDFMNNQQVKTDSCYMCSHGIICHNEYVRRINERYNKDEMNYRINSIYKGYDEYVNVTHLKCGHTWDVIAGHFLNSPSECPRCNMYRQESQGELELRNYIESLGIECLDKKKSEGILKEEGKNIGQDIDILTTINIGFEYNGEFFHHEGNGKYDKPIGYHRNKIRIAKKQGITLYHIWERDWKKRPEEVKKFVKKVIKKYFDDK